MKPDEKCRQLSVDSQAADKVLDEALQPILKKLTIAGTDTARGQSSLEEDVRLIAAMDAWHDVNVQVLETLLRKTLALTDMDHCSVTADRKEICQARRFDE